MKELHPLALQYLGPKGPFASELLSFESRPEQLQMASAVFEAVEHGSVLLAEAGTGVGKSLAYLLPFCLWASEHGKKAMISTQTKTLQQQLLEKDLPLVSKALGKELRVSLCLGSGNYLCPLRMERALQDQMTLLPSSEPSVLAALLEWSSRTHTGLRHDIPFFVPGDVWSEVARESDLCMGFKCEHIQECFYYAAKARERKSQILLVNHHLYFSNEAIGGKALPEFDGVVFDEAHHLEEVATQHLGISLTNQQMLHVFHSVMNPQTQRGALMRMTGLGGIHLEKARQAVLLCLKEMDQFLSKISVKVGEASVFRIKQKGWIHTDLCDQCKNLRDLLKSFLPYSQSEEEEIELAGLAGRAESLGKEIETFVAQEDRSAVYWVESFPHRKRIRQIIHVTPIDVSQALQKRLFRQVRPLVLTSATLSDGESFEFLRQRLGIEEAEEILVGSPFKYSSNVLLFASPRLPDPKETSFEIPEVILDLMEHLLRMSRGGVFVLFTSYKSMRRAYQALKGRLEADFSLLIQGEKPSHKLLEEFKESGDSVLFATSSFWQGVDVPGPALRCVIIVKLPFAVPDDPVTEARMEHLVAQGKDPFSDYQLPQSILRFRQGFGRLIRSKTDRGVVAVLDPRILTRRYGRLFLKGIPRCKETTVLEEVESFFDESG